MKTAYLSIKAARSSKPMALFLAVMLVAAAFMPGTALAINPDAPPSLKTVPIPEPPDLFDYIQDKNAAIRLGKALFWDMQVGSDGVQSCASCHFHAGADIRAKNQLSPDLLGGDTTFQLGGPNYTLTASDFPFHRLLDPDNRNSTVLFDTNDVASSQGVFLTEFLDIMPFRARDKGIPISDPVFNVKGKNVRRVEPRNTPTVIDAVFNFANFWDGRANHFFNGVNPFGPSDLESVIFVNNNCVLEERAIRICNASLASQAVGPPLSDFEMSFRGRTFPKLGKKMLTLRPLGKQLVHPQDSVLGPLSKARLSRKKVTGQPGLKTTYCDMIKAAFRPEYWNSKQLIKFGTPPVHAPDVQDPRFFPLGPGDAFIANVINPNPCTDEFTQMEANFSLFFGLSVQLYEATLIADDTPFDRFQEGDDCALTEQQQEGLDIFLKQGKCINCHGGPEFTNASVANTMNGEDPPDADAMDGADPCELPKHAIEKMEMAVGEAIYDNGFYNIGVRPTAEDIGRGGTDPFGFPLSFSRLGELKAQGLLPAELAAFVPDLPEGVPPDFRVAVDGAFKTPGLRNVELTGPYFHNGGNATLRQVVDFYTRGGDFHEANIDNLDPDIDDIGFLKGHDDRKDALVSFLLALTDERVRQEIAPFDHPQLFVPNGERGNDQAVIGDPNRLKALGFSQVDEVMEVPVVGAGGRPAAGLPPLQSFLRLDPFQP